MTVPEELAFQAKSHAGRQYRPNECGIAVADVFRDAGLANLLPPRPEWVPNWSAWGTKVSRLVDVRAGDIILYNWSGRPPDPADGGGGYDHIGIAIGDASQAVNVSTANGYSFVSTPITSFQEARRFVEPAAKFAVKTFWRAGHFTLMVNGIIAWSGKTPDVGEGSLYLREGGIPDD